MNIDFKQTIWYRVNIIPGKEKEALALCKSGKINYPEDLVDAGVGEYDKFLLDTTNQMAIEENQECSTIEIVDYYEEWNNTMFLTNDNIIDNEHIRISPEGFIFKKIDIQEAGDNFNNNKPVYRLYDDCTESLIETEEDFNMSNNYAIEIGKISRESAKSIIKNQ